MKCLICNSSYEGFECPNCKFPYIAFPGDPEEGIRRMKPQIDAYRDAFLEKLSLGVVSYYWKEQDGRLVLDREEVRSIGSGKELQAGAVWLEQPFARLPEAESLTIRLALSLEGGNREFSVRLPNLLQPELQQLGAEMNEQMQIRLLLRNSSGSTASEWVSLFA